MNLEHFKKHFRQKLINNLPEALSYLEKKLSIKSPSYTTFVLKYTEYKKWKSNIQKGVLAEHSEEGITIFNRIVNSLYELVNNLTDQDLSEDNKEISDIEDQAKALAQSNKDNSVKLKEIVSNFLQNQATGNTSYLTTGFIGIDTLLSGIEDRSLTLISSNDISNSRVFIINSLLRITKNLAKKVLYISASNSKNFIAGEFISINSKLPNFATREPFLNEQDLKAIEKAYSETSNLSVFIVDDLEDSNQINTAIIGRALIERPDVVVIDNHQFINGHTNNSDLFKLLKGISKKVLIPIILLSKSNNNISTSELGFQELAREEYIFVDNVISINIPSLMGIFEGPNGESLHGLARLTIEKSQRGHIGTYTMQYNTIDRSYEDDKLIIGMDSSSSITDKDHIIE